MRSAPTRTHAEDHAARRRRSITRGAVLLLVLAGLVALAMSAASTPPGSDGAKKRTTAHQAGEPAEVACGGEAPAPAHPGRYERAPSPSEVLESGTDYGAVVHTSCGDIEIDLLEQQAPQAVASFVFLAREGFYEGLLWNRIEDDFIIQTGDPNNRLESPPDGPGYTLPDELAGVRPRDYVYGVVALANSGPNTGGSEFFIVVHRGPHDNSPAGLPNAYTIFGRVSPSSFGVIDEIASQKTHPGYAIEKSVRSVHPVYVESIDITEEPG